LLHQEKTAKVGMKARRLEAALDKKYLTPHAGFLQGNGLSELKG